MTPGACWRLCVCRWNKPRRPKIEHVYHGLPGESAREQTLDEVSERRWHVGGWRPFLGAIAELDQPKVADWLRVHAEAVAQDDKTVAVCPNTCHTVSLWLRWIRTLPCPRPTRWICMREPMLAVRENEGQILSPAPLWEFWPLASAG